ncbi:retrotransposon ty3-gypsy subclass protein [Lasallia pustulata]|uniref:Retrotransposon ty3-gypsy subclass protein n=1 Tax=Lasallia pustulata TaxID=136370 RepID=A0A1W5CZ68_9LECA|nr:retrotransposon ty3-gypsy subclass protein [Lasallia pustulata]
MLLTKLGLHRIILGKPWLNRHGVILDMKDDQLSFPPGRCDQLRCLFSNKISAPNSAKLVDKAVITESPKYSILKRQKAPLQKKSLSVPGSTTPLLPDKTFNNTVDIAIIGAAAFNRLNTRQQYQDGVQLFSMTIQEMEKALSEQTADNTSEINISVLSMEEVLAKKLKEYLDENLKKGFISPSHAPYASPVLFAVKLYRSLQVCVDYRKLNAITKRNWYLIPLIKETLAKVTGCKYLTMLDVIAAFNKLRMHPNSEDYTTFITSMGAYKYHVLPFGLTNGPANYQHYMNNVLWDHLNNFCSAYLDDILIYSKILKEHTQHVWAVLQKLIDAGLQVDIEKCKFHVQETSFLGVLLSTDGLRMDPKKAFIGFCNFYRLFIKGFSKIVGPMLKLTQKEKLSEYKFKIMYQTGAKNVKADALTRKPGDKPINEEDDRLKYQHQTILTPDRLKINMLEPDPEAPIHDRILNANRDDEECSAFGKAIANKRKAFNRILMANCSVRDGILYHHNRLWVPGNIELMVELIREVHDLPSGRHPGIHRTMEVIGHYYYWPNMRRTVE